jgi:hypothetical protein
MPLVTFALVFLLNGNAYIMDTGLSESDCIATLMKVAAEPFVCESEKPAKL